ncbi:hypothetical protein PAMA_006618 [Pampus argenteus]
MKLLQRGELVEKEEKKKEEEEEEEEEEGRRRGGGGECTSAAGHISDQRHSGAVQSHWCLLTAGWVMESRANRQPQHAENLVRQMKERFMQITPIFLIPEVSAETETERTAHREM